MKKKLQIISAKNIGKKFCCYGNAVYQFILQFLKQLNRPISKFYELSNFLFKHEITKKNGNGKWIFKIPVRF